MELREWDDGYHFFYRFDSRYDGILLWILADHSLHSPFFVSTYTALIICMIFFFLLQGRGCKIVCFTRINYDLTYLKFYAEKVGISSSCLALKRFTLCCYYVVPGNEMMHRNENWRPIWWLYPIRVNSGWSVPQFHKYN